MPATRTLITEIVTGLGTLGFRDVDHALRVRPAAITNVEDEHFERLAAARQDVTYDRDFEVSWRNGVTFAQATDGLRCRPPWSIEWKGNHRPPRYDQIPADLRIDHVYLVSCKYGSNILTNSSPANLFDRRLADRTRDRSDWFSDVAPDAYQDFYAACRDWIRSVLGNRATLPELVEELEPTHRVLLKQRLPRRLTGPPADAYRRFAHDVAEASTRRWIDSLATSSLREEMLWRLLRLQPAPYFVLGESAEGSSLRYRVGTPGDFRSRFRMRSLAIEAQTDRSQAVVGWSAQLVARSSGDERTVAGHVEVRWSHGRFSLSPEAKVYLDTPHHAVPGYFPLAETATDGQLTFPR